jgi:isopentenyl phosphate kinase
MLVFLKLGGSLITDKNTPLTPRKATLYRLAMEIAQACKEVPDLRLLIGHGSGSFGHFTGKKFATRQGVFTNEQWHGFAEVWFAARTLNQIVVEAFSYAGLPVLAFPPSACVISRNGEVAEWDIKPIQAAIQSNLVPLVNGDVVFDDVLGGTILSTEDLFFYLAQHLKPDKIILAGIEAGVWADYPKCTRLIETITPGTYLQVAGSLNGSASIDVTGGMAQKVELMLNLVSVLPGMQALIFSADQNRVLYNCLTGSNPGTLIRA